MFGVHLFDATPYFTKGLSTIFRFGVRLNQEMYKHGATKKGICFFLFYQASTFKEMYNA